MEQQQGEEPKTPEASILAFPEPSKIKTTTLGALGAMLPIGLSDATGGFAKDIALRPWRLKEERELGDQRDKQRDANVFSYVSMVLATMCTRLGPHDFEKMKPEQRRVITAQMYMPDIFYAYTHLRVQALGANFEAKVNCARCRAKSEMTFDLNTVEVKTVEKYDDAVWEYELANPFTLRGKLVKKMHLGPSRWNVYETIPTGTPINGGSAKALVICGSIIGINDDRPVQIADSELDDMSKRDLEKLTAMIDDLNIGPKMAIDDKCPKCSAPLKLPIDWGYDNFFASSSR